jgi:hypothetical protein
MGKHGSNGKHHHHDRVEESAPLPPPPPPPAVPEPATKAGRGAGEGGGGRFATLAAATAIAAVVATMAGTGLQYTLAQQSRSDTRQTQQSQFAQISLAVVGRPAEHVSPVAIKVRVENDTAGETVARGCQVTDKEIFFSPPTLSIEGTQAAPRGAVLADHLSYPSDPDASDFHLGPGDKQVFTVQFPPARDGTTRITMGVSCVSHNTDTSRATVALSVIVFGGAVWQVQLPQAPAAQA